MIIMSIISRYIIREILRYFLLILLAVVGIYLMVDFFERIDNFMESGVPLVRSIPYFLYKIPFIVAQILPVGVLLSVLVVFGIMKRDNEIVALKAGGMSAFYLVRIVAMVGLAASAILFVLSEMVVPVTIAKSNRIWLGEVRKKLPASAEKKNIWLRDKGQITHIVYFNPVSNTIYTLKINYFDQWFKLVRRIDAKSAIYRGDRWILKDVLDQRLDAATGTYAAAYHRRLPEKLSFVPADLRRIVKPVEEMGYVELRSYVRKLESEGYDSTKYRVDLQAKIAFPLVCIVLCLIGTGISLGTRGSRKEGLAIIIAVGLGLSFLYWVFYSFCVSLGYGEMLPPVVAVWLANVIFSCLGLFTLLNAE